MRKKSFNYYISDFLAFLLAKFLITLSKSTCLTMLDSVAYAETFHGGVSFSGIG